MSYQIIDLGEQETEERFQVQYHGFGYGRHWDTLATFRYENEARAWIEQRANMRKARERAKVIATYEW